MEVTAPPAMLVDPAINQRESAVGTSVHTIEQRSSSELGSAIPVLGEQPDIRALDLVGALVILIAEIRDALALVADPLQPTVPQSPIPGQILLERPLTDNVIPELPPLEGLLLAEPELPEIASLLEVSVHEGMTPWPSANAVLLAEAELMNAAMRVIDSALGAPPAQLGSATAPFAVIQMMLRRLPAEESQLPAAWLITATQVEAAVRNALDKAYDAVSAWRAVPPAVVAVIGDARTVVLAALDEDLLNPLWLMPEMMRILPLMRRYWRLRRRLRRSLTREEARRSDDRDDRDDAAVASPPTL